MCRSSRGSGDVCLGGAIGDALGAPVEFMRLGEITSHFDSGQVDGYLPAYGRDAGAITDDTQMTLFTVEGLIRMWVRRRLEGEADASVIHRAYRRWYRTQTEAYPASFDVDDGWLLTEEWLWSRRAPGNTCLSGLAAARELGSRVANDSKGCGTVMRSAPLGMVSSDPMVLADECSGLTHGHPTSGVS